MKIQEIQGIVITFVLIGILMGVGMTVLYTLGQSQLDDTNHVEQLRLWTINCTPFTYSKVTTPITRVVNTTGSTLTVSYDATGTHVASCLTLVSPTTANGTIANVTYVYGADSAATTAVNSTTDAIDDFVPWFVIIIVIIAAAIIINLVIRSFSGRN